MDRETELARPTVDPYGYTWQLADIQQQVLAADPHADIAKLYTKPSADLRYMPLANYLQDLYEVVRPLPPLESITQPRGPVPAAPTSIGA